MDTIPALEKQRQKNCYKFTVSLGYTLLSHVKTQQ